MASTDPVHPCMPAAPVLLDVVHVRLAPEPAHRDPGVVIDIFRQPTIKNGDRYRVEFHGGVTAWFWRADLIVYPWAEQRDIVRTDLAAIRTILYHPITAAAAHDVLNAKLSTIFDTLTATANAYLGGSLDT